MIEGGGRPDAMRIEGREHWGLHGTLLFLFSELQPCADTRVWSLRVVEVGGRRQWRWTKARERDDVPSLPGSSLVSPPRDVQDRLDEFARPRLEIIGALLKSYTLLQPRWKGTRERRAPYPIEPNLWRRLKAKCILAQHALSSHATNEIVLPTYQGPTNIIRGAKRIYVLEEGVSGVFSSTVHDLKDRALAQKAPDGGDPAPTHAPSNEGSDDSANKGSNAPEYSWHDTLLETINRSNGALNKNSKPLDLLKALRTNGWIEEDEDEMRVYITASEEWSKPIRKKTFSNMAREALNGGLEPHGSSTHQR
jgi:hypothetical protein